MFKKIPYFTVMYATIHENLSEHFSKQIANFANDNYNNDVFQKKYT